MNAFDENVNIVSQGLMAQLCCKPEPRALLVYLTCLLRPRQKFNCHLDGLVHILRVLRGAVWVCGASVTCGESFVVCCDEFQTPTRILLNSNMFLTLLKPRYCPHVATVACLSKPESKRLSCALKDGSRNATNGRGVMRRAVTSEKHFQINSHITASSCYLLFGAAVCAALSPKLHMTCIVGATKRPQYL